MIIGGDEIYRIFGGLVNKVFLTEVFHKFKNGDAFFPTKFDRRKWATVTERDYRSSDFDEYPFRISVLERRRKTVRQRDPSEFLTLDRGASDWAKQQVLRKAPAQENLPEEQFDLPLAGSSP